MMKDAEAGNVGRSDFPGEQQKYASDIVQLAEQIMEAAGE